MSEWLEFEDFVPHAPSNVGEQTAVPHSGCTPKDKLYIKRTEDDSVIAWCHVCRKRGKYSNKGTRNIHKLKAITKSTVTNEVSLPADCNTNIDEWPTHARVWVLRYGITLGEINDYSMAYSPSFDRVILPCYSDDGDLLGWQGRDTEQTREGSPKYITQRKAQAGFYFKAKTKRTASGSGGDCTTLVITEDILSAIKSSRVVDAVSILGVWLSPEDVMDLAHNYTTVIVYLDNDNAAVIQQQENLKRLFRLFGCTVVVHRGTKDPKELSTKELEKLYDV